MRVYSVLSLSLKASRYVLLWSDGVLTVPGKCKTSNGANGTDPPVFNLSCTSLEKHVTFSERDDLLLVLSLLNSVSFFKKIINVLNILILLPLKLFLNSVYLGDDEEFSARKTF